MIGIDAGNLNKYCLSETAAPMILCLRRCDMSKLKNGDFCAIVSGTEADAANSWKNGGG
jgi:hypothetical protein